MSEVRLNSIERNATELVFRFDYSPDMEQYFHKKSFLISYPFDVSDVPESILSIPFACSVLPICWLTGSTLSIRELDRVFFDAVPNILNGYRQMLPFLHLDCAINCESIIDNVSPFGGQRSAMFFSGGVDSVYTLISHLEEDIDLLSIWGSDIRFDNAQGWNELLRSLNQCASSYGKQPIVIHSEFRVFDNEGVIDSAYSKLLNDNYWHGMKHSIALIGHAAPLAYIRGYSNLYVASTHCPEDGRVICASQPMTDDHVRFCQCSVKHDGYLTNRQGKVERIVEYSNEFGTFPIMHVCWQTQTGMNCCRCEKCLRTIFGILAEGGDPTRYGFPQWKESVTSLDIDSLLLNISASEATQRLWLQIARRIRSQSTALKKTEFWRIFKRLAKLASSDPRKIRPSRIWLRKRKVRGFLGRVYRRIMRTTRKVIFAVSILLHRHSVFLIGTPTHGNLGDAAIVMAEKDLIKSVGRKCFEITDDDAMKYLGVLRRLLPKKKPLFLHGGGNMGNQWLDVELNRRYELSKLQCPVVIFPQSIFYTNDSDGRQTALESVEIYNKPSICILAREKYSYDFAKGHYPLAKSFLVPDSVLSYGVSESVLEIQHGEKVGLYFRKDLERLQDLECAKEIEALLNSLGYECYHSDMVIPARLDKHNREENVLAKMREIRSAKLVITDRLHAMIFSYLVGTPCIVLPNNNEKIVGTYEWIRDCNYVHLAKSVDATMQIINDFLMLGEVNKSSLDAKQVILETLQQIYR